MGDTATAYTPYCDPHALQFDHCKGGYFSTLAPYGLQVTGESRQDGVPTPEAPLPIRCVRAGTKVKVCGKNLAYPSRMGAVRGTSVTVSENADGSYTLQGTSPANQGGHVCIDTDPLPHGTYTLRADWSGTSTCPNFRIHVGENGSWGSHMPYREVAYRAGSVCFSFELASDEPKTIFVFCGSLQTDVTTLFLQLEAGDTATDYEKPYLREITVPCDLYAGDTWYPATGQVVKVNRVLVPDGRENWFATSSQINEQGVYIYGFDLPGDIADFAEPYSPTFCDRFRFAYGYGFGADWWKAVVDGGGWYSVHGTPWYGRISFSSDIDTVEAFAAWIAAAYDRGEPVTLVFRLQQPQTEWYPPQPIAAQPGTVHVLQAATDLPAALSATMPVRRGQQQQR